MSDARGAAAAQPGGRVFWNVAANLAGHGVPLVVAVLAFPPLIAALGVERFGVLTLAWVLIGYFSLFDLGLGRALTKLVAERLGGPAESEIPVLIGTALAIMTALGGLGAVCLAWLTPWLVGHVLEMPVALHAEGVMALYGMAASLPCVIATAGLRGVLEALQRFDWVNAVRVPMGIALVGVPLLIVPFTTHLGVLIGALVLGRLVAMAVYGWLCVRAWPALRQAPRWIDGRAVPALLSFGGWMTVSNVLGPLLVYLDRFLIGAWISVSAVAYYVTPYELATRLWVLPAALVGVLFPMFASDLRARPERVASLYTRSVTVVLLGVFVLVLPGVVLAPEGLNGWLGAEFARQSAPVLQILLCGVLLNSAAHVPFALIQAAGRPDLTAKIHVAEVPFYVPGLIWAVTQAGIQGAAWAWLIRVGVDALAMFMAAAVCVPSVAGSVRRLLMAASAALGLIALGLSLDGVGLRWGYVLAISASACVVGFYAVLEAPERARCRAVVRGWLKKR